MKIYVRTNGTLKTIIDAASIWISEEYEPSPIVRLMARDTSGVKRLIKRADEKEIEADMESIGIELAKENDHILGENYVVINKEGKDE